MRYLYFFLLLFLLASCEVERRIFSPLPVDNPSLRKKNDFSVDGLVSVPFGIDVNGGFAVTDRLAIIAGGFFHKNDDDQVIRNGFLNTHDSSLLNYRHSGFTLGTGLIWPVDPKIFLNFYGGVTLGKFEMNEELYRFLPSTSYSKNRYNSTLNRYFIQGNINFHLGQFEMSYSSRLSFVNYDNIVTDYTDSELNAYLLPPFVSNKSNVFVDFSSRYKYYFSKDLSWGIQLFALYTSRTNNRNTDNKYYYYPARIGCGLFFRSTKK